ncbi:MAG: hypothetical protein AAGJ94_14205, partial [Pseudomonadota bacterium]
ARQWPEFGTRTLAEPMTSIDDGADEQPSPAGAHTAEPQNVANADEVPLAPTRPLYKPAQDDGAVVSLVREDGTTIGLKRWLLVGVGTLLIALLLADAF